MSNCDYSPGFIRGVSLGSRYNFKNKNQNVSQYVSYMLARTQSMFEYEGLPDSIPQRNLELMLQTNGNVCIAEYEGTLYAFTGGLGGEPNVYYMPTLYVVANPALEMSKTYTIDEDCVVIPSDSMFLGLLPLCKKYATQMVENDMSMNIVDIMARVVSLLSASSDSTRKSAELYLEKLEKGEFGVIADPVFLDGIRSQPISATSYNAMSPLIEYQQYIKASWLADIGLNANFNMKREALNSSESALNQDALLPFVDDMLRCRKVALEKVNAMFGTNISVRLASSWEDNHIEVDAEHEAMLAEAGVSTEGEPQVEGWDENPVEEPSGEESDDSSEPEVTPSEEEQKPLEEVVEELEEVVDELKEEVSENVLPSEETE